MSKSLRIINILQVIEALGRGTPKEIQIRTAARLNEDPDDPNFKRNIYRDLKELTDQGKLTAYYSSPDGAPLDFEDGEPDKNVRIEYCLTDLDDHGKILGWKLLKAAGFEFEKGPQSAISWKATNPAQWDSEKAHFQLLYQEPNGKILSLSVPWEDRPFQLIIGRQSDKKLLSPLPQRASYLYVSEPTVSRNDGKSRLGHCQISATKDGSILIADLKSSSGTFYEELDLDVLKQNWPERHSDQTRKRADLPDPENLKKITDQEVEVRTSTLLRLGNLQIFILF